MLGTSTVHYITVLYIPYSTFNTGCIHHSFFFLFFPEHARICFYSWIPELNGDKISRSVRNRIPSDGCAALIGYYYMINYCCLIPCVKVAPFLLQRPEQTHRPSSSYLTTLCPIARLRGLLSSSFLPFQPPSAACPCSSHALLWLSEQCGDEPTCFYS